jgi:hypothetical protein
MFDFIEIVIKGGPVMVPLLACSTIALIVVIERWFIGAGSAMTVGKRRCLNQPKAATGEANAE